jgi:transposase-like protein
MPEKQTRRSFTAEEKLTIVLETECAGETVLSVARRHGIVTSVVFRWRAELGFGKNNSAKLAPVKLADGRSGATSTPLVLRDLLQPPNDRTGTRSTGLRARRQRSGDGSTPRL